jgi:hypothetical protein
MGGGGNDYCNPQTNSANVCKIINCLESSTFNTRFLFFFENFSIDNIISKRHIIITSI